MVVEPTVSVILPVWNGQRFLAEAIASVIGQTFHSFELIVVDDGSTDRTRSIAHEFARKDPRVMVIGLAHAGVGRALNAGIHAAHGRYIARMDADDVSLPSRLHTQVAFLDAHPECVAVGCDFEVTDEDGLPIGALRFPPRHREIAQSLIDGTGRSMSAVVMRKEAVLAAGGYMDADLPAEDIDLWIRMREIGTLASIPEPLYRYRRHRDTFSVRERKTQLTTLATIVDAARARKGLSPLKRRSVPDGKNVAATYHNDCARFALKAGMRHATIRHARASIGSAPLQLEPYAVLAACALPTSAIQLAVKCYVRLQTIRSRPAS